MSSETLHYNDEYQSRIEDYEDDCKRWWAVQVTNPNIEAHDFDSDTSTGAYIINKDDLIVFFEPNNDMTVNGQPMNDLTLNFHDKDTALAFIDMVNEAAIKAGWKPPANKK